jgi:two-component system, sensor histidine kinase and response regulator
MSQLLHADLLPERTGAVARSDIMIVDDNPANLKLLEKMLTREGHEVRSFPRGRLALAAAMKNPPDLILLDINMPEMNGYEVCERLKSDSRLSDVAVIFLSALNETSDKVKGFQVGAVDYISKPFQFEEVHARVETHLKLHELRRALKSQNEHLEEVVAARTRQLAESNQRLTILDRSKNEFLALISHEFRTPLNGILGVAEIILEENCSRNENSELCDLFEQSRRRIISILDDALLLTEIDVNAEQFRPCPVSIPAVLRRAIENVAHLAQSRKVTITAPPEGQSWVNGNEKLLVRALHALLEAAIKFSEEGQDVRLSLDLLPQPCVIIESLGKTIPVSELPKFFDVFSISETSTAAGNLGLGPALASRILSLFGASVSVARTELPGVRFSVSLQPTETGA